MAQTVAGQSPYLTVKGPHCPHQRLLFDTASMLALTALDKKITGAQIIKPDGTKKLLSGSKKTGSFIAVSALEEPPTR
ncbi:hypothetical protein [Xenorhabdus miraniensis]|uniref:Propanediol utilization protein n=1 Tax=Xenorhabdus miraniensis TaxID=351674 RepID=A0A2D0JKJ2_9GAMM|nr:hypothetical protein [Xenorhabdus miraniensis]PHM46669.1 propanediol utilization protein [Xenorhabdus miraniensis]